MVNSLLPAMNATAEWQRPSFCFLSSNNKAMQKLPALLDSTGMLACGEDLGMIPATVPQVMSDLRILSLEIQRMPKSVEETFAHPSNYPYLSVCTTSTHDMNPVRAWWEEDREVTQQFWNMLLGNHGEAPVYCEHGYAGRFLSSISGLRQCLPCFLFRTGFRWMELCVAKTLMTSVSTCLPIRATTGATGCISPLRTSHPRRSSTILSHR